MYIHNAKKRRFLIILSLAITGFVISNITDFMGYLHYGKRISQRYYSYNGQTIRFDEYRNFYFLSYIEDNKATEVIRWNYHKMNAPFMALVYFADSHIELPYDVELFEYIKGNKKKSHFLFHTDSIHNWLDDANFAMVHQDYLNHNWAEHWSDSIYQRCCRIESRLYLEKEDRINELINSKIERTITVKHSY